MLDMVKYSLEMTKLFILPMFDKAADLKACVKNHELFGMNMRFPSLESLEKPSHPWYSYNEGILYVKELEFVEFLSKEDGEFQKITERLAPLMNDPEIYAKYTAEIKRRKAANIEVLRGLGLGF